MTEHCQVVTTVDSGEAAQTLARGVVETRLGACAQILGPIASTYWWQGQIETAAEWQVVVKTTTDRYPELERHLRAAHPYEVPEILCFAVQAGNPDYLSWLTEQTRQRGEPAA